MPEQPPSFPMYARDWYIGTRSLSAAARGCHADLMAVAWINGSVPANPDELRRICGVEKPEWRRVWPELEGKWPIGDDGGRRNPKLEGVRSAAKAFHETKQGAGQKGGRVSAERRAKAKQDASKPVAATPAEPNLAVALAIATADPTDTESVSVDARTGPRAVPANDYGPSPARRFSASNAFQSSIGLNVPMFQHHQFADRLRNAGVENPEPTLLAWYAFTEQAWKGRKVGEKAPAFWDARFEEEHGRSERARPPRVAGLNGGGVPASTKPRWRCHHTDDVCGINAHCFTRTMRELRAGTVQIDDVPEPLRTECAAVLDETRRPA